jgi:hypothetical protein
LRCFVLAAERAGILRFDENFSRHSSTSPLSILSSTRLLKHGGPTMLSNSTTILRVSRSNRIRVNSRYPCSHN